MAAVILAASSLDIIVLDTSKARLSSRDCAKRRQGRGKENVRAALVVSDLRSL
jgi:hypothetical protein